jgi:hypothetical protein
MTKEKKPAAEQATDLPTLQLISDEPISERKADKLGYRELAETIARAAVGTEGPLTIGVSGEWGAGKTSMLQLVKSRLQEDASRDAAVDNVLAVWFNAWEEEHIDRPVVSLMAAIAESIERKGLVRWYGWLLALLGWLKKRGAWLAARTPLHRLLRAVARKVSSVMLGIWGWCSPHLPSWLTRRLRDEALSVSAMKLRRTLRSVATTVSEWKVNAGVPNALTVGIPSMFSVQANFKGATEQRRELDAFKKVAQGKNRNLKVVVFIDDLDRCLPWQAVRLLEAIKLALGQRCFVFVLGLDPRHLIAHMVKLYHDQGITTSKADGQSYFQKLVQVWFNVPKDEEYFPTFVGKHIELVSRLGVLTPGTDQSYADLIKKHVAPYAGAACYWNPRRVVRLLNMFITELSLYEQRNDQSRMPHDEFEMLCARTLIQSAHPYMYRDLVQNPSLAEELLKKLDQGGATGDV